jgi:prepilin-type N-terminal cleavage/methylation domain-containing protein
MTVRHEMRIGHHSVRGFTLIEFIIVTALLSIALVYSLRQKVSSAEELLATAAGQQMRDVGVTAVTQYMVENYQTIVANPTTTITTTNLVTAGFLPKAFNGVNPWGATYQIQFRRIGAGPDYNIEALTLLNKGTGSDNLAIKPYLIGLAINQVGAEGGMSINNTTFQMFGGSTDTTASADFPGVLFAGNQLGAKISYGSSMFNQFVRRDGSLPMTGPNPLNMAGQSIINNNDIATNTVTIPSTGDINFGPRAHKLSWLLPRLVEMEGYYVNDGQTISKPVCDAGGQQSVVLSPVSVRSQPYPGDGMSHLRMYVENVGGTWFARIKGWDLVTPADGGGGFPSAFARTFCFYP